MEFLTLKKIAELADGRLVLGRPDVRTNRLCTDSRNLQPGDLFVAIAGERFDGHEFLAQAAAMGALGAIVHRLPEQTLTENFAIIEVDDTLAAFQRIAARYRDEMPIRVVGITGSNGKTSTKDLTAAVLGQCHTVVKTEGNFNNHIGVPITLLRLHRCDEIAVVEMGMNHAGEIPPLAAMAKPEVAIITNVGIAHIEHLGSRENIAIEKGRLAEAVDETGVVILCAEDDYCDFIRQRSAARVVTVGLQKGEVRAENITQDMAGSHFTLVNGGERCAASLPIPGLHMVRNALLAVAAGLYFGVPIEDCAAGLAQVRLTKGRLQQKTVGGLHILDDSYNANPDSMDAALRTLAQLETQGRRIAVLGRMGELGQESENGHRRVGEAAAREQIDCLVTVGEDAAWIAETAEQHGLKETYRVGTTDEAAALLRQVAHSGDLILVKGSRAAAMEKVVENLSQRIEEEARV